MLRWRGRENVQGVKRRPNLDLHTEIRGLMPPARLGRHELLPPAGIRRAAAEILPTIFVVRRFATAAGDQIEPQRFAADDAVGNVGPFRLRALEKLNPFAGRTCGGVEKFQEGLDEVLKDCPVGDMAGLGHPQPAGGDLQVEVGGIRGELRAGIDPEQFEKSGLGFGGQEGLDREDVVSRDDELTVEMRETDFDVLHPDQFPQAGKRAFGKNLAAQGAIRPGDGELGASIFSFSAGGILQRDPEPTVQEM